MKRICSSALSEISLRMRLASSSELSMDCSESQNEMDIERPERRSTRNKAPTQPSISRTLGMRFAATSSTLAISVTDDL